MTENSHSLVRSVSVAASNRNCEGPRREYCFRHSLVGKFISIAIGIYAKGLGLGTHGGVIL
jgi:hypothetical protein